MKTAAIIGAVIFGSLHFAIAFSGIFAGFVLPYTDFFIYYFYVGQYFFIISLIVGTLIYALVGAILGNLISKFNKPKVIIYTLLSILGIIIIIFAVSLATRSVYQSRLDKIDCEVTDTYCLSEKAMLENDYDICGIRRVGGGPATIVKNKELEAECLTNIALFTNNDSICNLATKVQNLRGDCFKTIAYIKRDPLLCDKVGASNYLISCKSVINSYNDAIEKQDVSECCNVGEQRLGLMGTGSCAGKIAALTGNYSLCNPRLCYGDAISPNYCSYYLAKETRDLSACEEVYPDSFKRICLNMEKLGV